LRRQRGGKKKKRENKESRPNGLSREFPKRGKEQASFRRRYHVPITAYPLPRKKKKGESRKRATISRNVGH